MYNFVMFKIFEDETEVREDDLITGKIILLSPANFLDCYKDANLLKEDNIILVNISNMKPDQKQKYVDFLCGVVLGISGKVRKIGKNVMICVPEKFEMKGEITGGI